MVAEKIPPLANDLAMGFVKPSKGSKKGKKCKTSFLTSLAFLYFLLPPIRYLQRSKYFHSNLNAIIGSTFVARLAGTKQASNATSVSNKASAP